MLSKLDFRSTHRTNELCFVKFYCNWPNFTFPGGLVGGWVGGAKSRLKTNSAKLKLKLGQEVRPKATSFFN